MSITSGIPGFNSVTGQYDYNTLNTSVLSHTYQNQIYSDPAVIDEYLKKRELEEEAFRQKKESLATIFPRGYEPIKDFYEILEIAGEDLLNPVYEQTLKEFEEAQATLHRAARKLASAVKLVDSEKLAEKKKQKDPYGLTGSVGNPGPVGTPGPRGYYPYTVQINPNSYYQNHQTTATTSSVTNLSPLEALKLTQARLNK